jgi:hypothetical protein
MQKGDPHVRKDIQNRSIDFWDSVRGGFFKRM